MNRCLNDAFAYCKGNSQQYVHEYTITCIDIAGRKYEQPCTTYSCLLNSPTCGNYLTHTLLQGYLVAVEPAQPGN